MASTIAEHFSDEIIEWRRTIAFYSNVMHDLTTKLEEVINRNSIPNIAEKVEKYQQQLNVAMDQFFKLQSFFDSQESSLKKNSGFIEDASLDSETGDRQAGLRERMQKAEKRFIRARNNCSDFLGEIFKR